MRDPETGADEMRLLLERLTPRPAAPDDRLEQVRERVRRRRRRRRAAGGAAGTVTALILAGTVLPSVVQDTSPPTRPALPAQTPPQTPPDEPSTVAFPRLAGLSLRLPASWHALDMTIKAAGEPAPPGFFATEPLTQPASCTGKYRWECLPLRQLSPGGAIVTLSLWPGKHGADKARTEGHGLQDVRNVAPACAKVGGTVAYSGTIGDGSRSDAAVGVEVCAARDRTPGAADDIQQILNSIRFASKATPSGSYAAPGTAPPTGRDTPPSRNKQVSP
ncbi:hypothetical protein [Streptomyces sp. NPDC020965]|uniref:hypothetical protein n=1 Tax=Streptomyces sp. NPDC020965 TaxID=3365105 RepID=UPI0037AD3927